LKYGLWELGARVHWFEEKEKNLVCNNEFDFQKKFN
jgi:hypothetical protein